uniref:F-box domain-containing protein n=1 Tax=Aegilops tauschii TaxID=37682 RepID=R7W345_AEGTA
MSSTDSSDTSDPDSSDLRQATSFFLRSVGARRLFDRMPPGIDCIGALPEGILHHILSFLPAQEAVRTCVLAQRWRHLWKCTTGLRIVGNKGPVSVQLLRKFMDHLLILRERTDLDTVGIEFRKFREDDVPFVNLWIRFALQSKAVCSFPKCSSESGGVAPSSLGERG